MEKWYLQNVSRIYVGKFLCYDKKNLIFNFSWDQQEVTFTAWNWKPQFKKKKKRPQNVLGWWATNNQLCRVTSWRTREIAFIEFFALEWYG
jgi:hypothetical protein